MTPPLLGVGEEESHSNVTILTSSTSIEELGHIRSGFKERNYMGLSDCSSVDSSTVTTGSNESKTSLNLKATELSLGLPGSQSPDRDSELNMKKTTTQIDEKPLFPLHPSKDAHYSSSHKAFISGNKRVFSDAMDGFSEGINNSEVNAMLSPRPNSNATLKAGTIPENIGNHPGKVKETDSQKIIQERTYPVTETRPSYDISANNSDNAPAPKAQVVGWPPIRSFRKNSLATPSKNSNEVDGKAMAGALFVKVSMDGAPYLRKVDLRSYCAYKELSSALEKMFSCFTIGQYGSNGTLGREMLSESKLIDLLHGSEYVLTYEDKDGDWMLVGDVPWKMFIDSCKRMRIMKSSDAIGLAPRAVAKCRDRN